MNREITPESFSPLDFFVGWFGFALVSFGLSSDRRLCLFLLHL